MITKKIVLAALLAPFVFSGCLMSREPRRVEGVVIAPPLPAVVVLGDDPYYVHGGYHYHYKNNGWYYSRSGKGPWVVLPRERCPREVRFKHGHDDGGRGRGRGRGGY